VATLAVLSLRNAPFTSRVRFNIRRVDDRVFDNDLAHVSSSVLGRCAACPAGDTRVDVRRCVADKEIILQKAEQPGQDTSVVRGFI
jgi:hypothetical protein